MKKCIFIPREIVDEHESDSKRVLLYSYLCCHRTILDTVCFSIDDMCKWTLGKPSKPNSAVPMDYRAILNRLNDMKYFTDFHEVGNLPKGSIFKYCHINLNPLKFDINQKCAKIYLDEIQKILNLKKELNQVGFNDYNSRINAGHILLVLAYLRINMHFGNELPKCCMRYNATIAKELNIPIQYIADITAILDRLNIIKSTDTYRYSYKDDSGIQHFRCSSRVYANYELFDRAGEKIRDYNYKTEIARQVQLFMQGQAGN